MDPKGFFGDLYNWGPLCHFTLLDLSVVNIPIGAFVYSEAQKQPSDDGLAIEKPCYTP